MNESQEHCKYKEDADGTKHGVSSQISLSILPDGQTKLFNRNAKRLNGSQEEVSHQRCVVGELNGVKTYVRILPTGQVQVVITTQELFL